MGKALGTVAIALFAMLSGILQTRAATPTDVGGWTIERYSEPHTCDAVGPVSGNVSLVIAIIGPEFLLLISSPEFDFAKGTYPVSISIDGGPQVTLNADGEEGTYAIAMVRGLGMALRSASTLTATAGNKTYTFAFQHADAAMDAASRCAGEPSYLESFAHPPQRIDGAGDWTLLDSLPGADHCSLRLNGAEVDTMLIRNKLGSLILMAGRSDWAFPAGAAKVTLQIDDAPPQDIDASVFNNLVFVPVKDRTTEEQLMHADHLRWHLPWGDFRAHIAGLNAAIDALRSCDQKKADRKPG